jgi:hypothetical protein
MEKVILLFWLMSYMALPLCGQAKPGNVIISEIMADPNPPVLLPSQEYLEITNRTGEKINLEGWKLISADNKSTTFPVSEIGAGEYVVLCATADTGLFTGYGKVIALKSFPVLTDGGKLLILADSRGVMIHCVEYIASWYGDPLRSGGGWSLEMIDTNYPFFAGGNWRGSVNPDGGTPCKPNSVRAFNPDLFFAGITNVFPTDSIHLAISFSEPVSDPEAFRGKITLSGMNAESSIIKDLTGKGFIIVPQVPFKMGSTYILGISPDLTDLSGNRPELSEFEFGLPELPAKEDVVFNELLFDPLPGDADYIELYNKSVKPIDASDLYFASRDDATGKTSGIFPVSEEKILIMPGMYHAVTTDKDAVVSRYYSGDSNRIFGEVALPSMPDDNGQIILMGRQLEVYDEVKYDKDMHFSLLSDPEGVSLEKINPKGSSLDGNSWHSASGSSGWGTPGAPNSVFSPLPVSDNSLQFSSTRITPDNDGIDDVLTIRLNLSGTGNVVSVLIFDENGTLVRKLTENLLSGPETYLSWDGSDEAGSLLRSGIYIFVVTLFNDSGKTGKWKRVCTVIR